MRAAELRLLLPLTKIGELYSIPISIGEGRQPCPFCGSNTAFKITRNMYYHCYKCRKSGDAFKMLSDYGLARDFKDAYRKLLGHVNASHTYYSYVSNLKGLNEAFSIYVEEAKKNEAVIQSYFDSRGWKYVPGTVGFGTQNCLQKAGMSKAELQELQLYNPEYKTEYYNNHIIFPVKNPYRSVVHFCGRSIDPDAELRWKHTKGKIPINNYLYGSENVKGAKEIAICEGVSDHMSLQQVAQPAVAVFGVNIPLVHNAGVFKSCQSMVAIFDRDKYPLGSENAGEYKSWSQIIPHLIDLIVETRKPIYYLMVPSIPGVKDINDYLLSIEYDEEEYANWLKKKQPLHKLAFKVLGGDISKHDLLWRLQAAWPLEHFDSFFEKEILKTYKTWPEYLKKMYGA